MAKILVKHSAETNVKNKRGQTAFHLACMKGKTEIVEMLIDNAKYYQINFKDKDNLNETGLCKAERIDRPVSTSLEYNSLIARANGKQEIVELIQKKKLNI